MHGGGANKGGAIEAGMGNLREAWSLTQVVFELNSYYQEFLYVILYRSWLKR